MTGGALAAGLALAALALTLGFVAAPQRVALAFAAALAGALAAGMSGLGPGLGRTALALAALAVLAAAAIACRRQPPGAWSTLAIAIYCGAAAGLAAGGSPYDLGAPLLGLIAWPPARWLVERGWGLAVKVALAWLAAAAALSLGLAMTPTLGYEADHLE